MSDTKKQPVLHYLAPKYTHANGSAASWDARALHLLKSRGNLIEIKVVESELDLLEMLGRARNVEAPLSDALARPENQLPLDVRGWHEARAWVVAIIKTVETTVPADRVYKLISAIGSYASRAFDATRALEMQKPFSVEDFSMIQSWLTSIRAIALNVINENDQIMRPYTALSLIDDMARAALALLDGLPDRLAHRRGRTLRSRRDPGVAGAMHTGGVVPPLPERLVGEEYRETAIDPERLRALTQNAE